MNKRQLWIQATVNVAEKAHELVEIEFKRLVGVVRATVPFKSTQTYMDAFDFAVAELIRTRVHNTAMYSVSAHSPMQTPSKWNYKKIAVIKECRAQFNIGLKEAKDTIDDAYAHIEHNNL